MAYLEFKKLENNACAIMDRAKVPGGWLIRETTEVLVDIGNGMENGREWRICMTFIPDPTHVWE